MANADSPVPPMCLTPSTNEVTSLQDNEEGRLMIFRDEVLGQDDAAITLRIVDCESSQSLTVREFQFADAKLSDRGFIHRPYVQTRIYLRDAIYSDEIYTFHSLRQLLRDNGGDGILGILPSDHCGCEAFGELDTGRLQ